MEDFFSKMQNDPRRLLEAKIARLKTDINAAIRRVERQPYAANLIEKLQPELEEAERQLAELG